MRYITYRLTWVDGYGYGPEQTIADNGGHLEASSWTAPSVEDGLILGYLYGDQSIDFISNWNPTELTEDEALAFAKGINNEAIVNEAGIIIYPEITP